MQTEVFTFSGSEKVCVCVCACVRERKRVGEPNEAKQMSQTVNSQIQ